MFNLNEIFYEDEDYKARADFCNKNGYVIQEIDTDENGRRFQIQKLPAPTQEEIKDNFRQQREVECFPIINRGQLWYDGLTEEQKIELKKWYQAWLNVTETLEIPEKPSWLK